MKVAKKILTKQSEKSLFGVKGVSVRLTRLSQETIQKYMNIPAENNCNIYLNIKDGRVMKVKQSGIKIPITITVKATIPESAEKLNTYRLRERKKTEEEGKKHVKKCSTVAVIGATVRKEQLWSIVKKARNDALLNEGAVVFGKQVGYSPWPCKIIQWNKSRTTATVQYFGFGFYIGKVKIGELVQLDESTKDSIENLVSIILRTKSIKDFDNFVKGINEIASIMSFENRN